MKTDTRENFKDAFNFVKVALMSPKKNYAEAKAHAEKLDHLLNFGCQGIERELFEKHRRNPPITSQQFWFGLDLQSLQTPYSEIVEMVQHLNPQPGQLWVDLGAGYGRIGIVLGFLCPLVQFLGFEIVRERVNESNRVFQEWKLNLAKMKQDDISTEFFSIGFADLYFIYDFGSKKDVYQVLEKLKIIAKTQPIRIIARGRGVRNWIFIDFPWLHEIHRPEHFLNWSLFRS